MRCLTVVVSLVAVVSASSAFAQDKPINTMCPVLTDEPIDPEITTVYKGKVIGLCCDRCLEKFERNPEKYVHRIPGWSDLVADGSAAGGGDDAGSGGGEAAAGDASGTSGGSVESRTSGESGDEAELSLAGRIHPALVHVPIAAIPLALLGLLAWLITGKDQFAKADALPMLVAAVAAVAAYLTGREAEAGQRFSPHMQQIVERHESAATVVLVLVLVLAVLRIWRWNRLTGTWLWAYGVGLVAASAVVGVTGYWGGSLVFGPEHFSLSL